MATIMAIIGVKIKSRKDVDHLFKQNVKKQQNWKTTIECENILKGTFTHEKYQPLLFSV